MRRITFAFAFTLSVLACGSKERELRADDVEEIAQKQLSSMTTGKKKSPPVFCPRGLDARVGATLVCSMPVEGRMHDVTMTVTEIQGHDVIFDVEVADEPRRTKD